MEITPKEQTGQVVDDKIAKPRSANFPAISLEKCLRLANNLRGKYQRNMIPWPIAIKALGYSLKSSAGLQATASMRYYGLIDVQGLGINKKMKLSDSAYNILIDTRADSSERDRLIRDAALTPPIFQKLVEQFPETIPDSDLLGHELKITYKIIESSVDDFIKVFTETMTFAKVYESDIIGDEQEVADEEIASTEKESGGNKMIDKAKQVGIPIMPKVGIVGVGSAGNVLSFVEFSPGLTFQLIAKENTHITQKTFERLIKFLELTKEDYPENWAIVADEPKKDACEPTKEKDPKVLY